MQILIMRHGKTELNNSGRYQGKTDISLCREGEQELILGGSISGVRKVYVSPLIRAKQTAFICFPNAVQHVVPDFSEMDFGRFEGKSYRDMEHDADYRAWVDGMCRGKCPGGESMEEFIERTAAAFEGIVRAALSAGERTLFITAHGGTAMAILSRFALPQKDYFEWNLKNGQAYLAQLSAASPLTLTDITRLSDLKDAADRIEL